MLRTTHLVRTSEIINTDTCKQPKKPKDILANIIIQDANMFGEFWYVTTWYIDDPNRYYSHVYKNDWGFNKPLTEMAVGDIVHLTHDPEIQFTVYNCLEQNKFCKILERI